MSFEVTLSAPQPVDDATREVFMAVKHEILHKIWELHREDEVHHLNQAREIEHLKFFRPILYRTENVPYGENFFGKIAVDEAGHCIHVRVFKGSEGIKFHSLHTRPKEDGGAVFAESDELTYFEY